LDSIENSRLNIERYRQSRNKPYLFRIGSWICSLNGLDDTRVEILKTFGQPHPQLLAVEESIERLEDSFRLPPKSCGLFVAWPNQLLETETETKSDFIELADDPGEKVPRARRWGEPTQELNRLVARRFAEFLVLLSDEQDGFRVTAALTPAMPHEEDPEREDR
jgi:hypothetical protein